NLLLKKKIKIFSPEFFITSYRIETVQDFFRELEIRSTSESNRKDVENMKDLLPSIAQEENIEAKEYNQWKISEIGIEKFKEIINKVKDKAAVWFGFKGTIDAVLNRVEKDNVKLPDYYITLEWLLKNYIENKNGKKLCIIVSSDRETLSKIIIEVLENSLKIRRKGTRTHDVLFLIDEAHEFLPQKGSGKEKECADTIERLTRMGRKYGLGICIASQRVAYLNTTAISNCHTTFIGSLPRDYDRGAVKNAYGISEDVLAQVVTFPPGHWYVVSSGATGMNNVPIRLITENKEKRLAEFFRDKNLLSPEAETFLKERKLIKSE
ncbi:hypothetical protein DRN74_01420, partial [Candidatus Micrarchaeota archaeon]